MRLQATIHCRSPRFPNPSITLLYLTWLYFPSSRIRTSRTWYIPSIPHRQHPYSSLSPITSGENKKKKKKEQLPLFSSQTSTSSHLYWSHKDRELWTSPVSAEGSPTTDPRLPMTLHGVRWVILVYSCSFSFSTLGIFHRVGCRFAVLRGSTVWFPWLLAWPW